MLGLSITSPHISASLNVRRYAQGGRLTSNLVTKGRSEQGTGNRKGRKRKKKKKQKG